MSDHSITSLIEKLEGAAPNATRFLAPMWRTGKDGRLKQVSTPLGRVQLLLMLRWAQDDVRGFQASRGGKPWPTMRPLIERGLMTATYHDPFEWRDGKWHKGWRRYEAGLTFLGTETINAAMCGMTADQFRYARYALGLTDDNSHAYTNELPGAGRMDLRKEYRARYEAMEAAGWAVKHESDGRYRGIDPEWFTLTTLGALVALLPGETLSEPVIERLRAQSEARV